MSQIKTKLQTLYGSTLYGITNLTALKNALRIINGADDLQVPDDLSSAEKNNIRDKAKEIPDLTAEVIDAYIKSMLPDDDD